ncbi:MAG: hypothetical protein M0T72_10655 [Candidatus Dormibacteraeota bacterium]|nr:hypothetical protein [Candidatus Dormibacteraeota bacterium]
MRGGADPGKVVGGVLASGPSPPVDPDLAAYLDQRGPVGATIDRTQNRIIFVVASGTLGLQLRPWPPAPLGGRTGWRPSASSTCRAFAVGVSPARA